MLAHEMLSRQKLMQGQEVVSKSASTTSIGPKLRRMNSSASWVGPGMLFQTPEPEAEDLMVSRQRSCDSILHSPRHRDREIDRSATRMYSSPCLTTQSVVDVQTLQD
ncbi:unnamed protein product, partial [Prorocentrum cordatum]